MIQILKLIIATIYLNKNNEVLEVSEFYQDIYTLDELKNNIKGFEFFLCYKMKKTQEKTSKNQENFWSFKSFL